MQTRKTSVLPREHVCSVVHGPDERMGQVASWVRAGLAAGERMIYVEARQRDGAFARYLDAQQVMWRGAARDGQLIIQTPQDFFLTGGSFDPDHRVTEHGAYVEESLAEGYPAVRLAADASAALEVITDRDGLLAYEAGLESLARTHPLSGLCFYERTAFAGDLMPFLNVHPRAVADVQLQAWAEPGRIRLVGEVDVSNVELVRAVLSQAAAQGGELMVDLSGLSFIDVGGTAELVDLPRRLSPGQRVILIRPPHQFLTIVEALGWEYELDLRDIEAS